MIRVEGLTLTYPRGAAPAVRDLTFDVAEGEVFGFLGPSGAGKSTTQNILIGLLRGWTGKVEVQGRPLREWGPDYYHTIGVSFESPNHHLKLTARENLEYFRSLYGPRSQPVDAVLGLVGLEAAADQRVGEYSKGMKNRLNFARSLLHDPELWFLDEPTAGLDPVNALRIREIIRDRRRQGVSTFLCTHDMNTVEAVCDRVAFIVDGAIAAIDSPEAFRLGYGERAVEVRWRGVDGQPETERFPVEGLADNPRFLEALRSPGLASVHSQEATLESVFARVTGRALR